MMTRSRVRALRRRPGFTLLEVLLASILAALVLAAAYSLFNTTLTQTQMSRDAAEIEDVARGVFDKIGNDVLQIYPPMPPKSGGNAAAGGGLSGSSSTSTSSSSTSSSGSTSTTTSSSSTSSSGSSSGSSSSGSSSSSSSGGATSNETAYAANYPFEAGVIGDDSGKYMSLYMGRTPEIYGRYSNPNDYLRADQRQVMYWFVQGSGLYRRERPWVTDPDVGGNIDLDPSSPETQLVSDEVTDMTFEFTDGENWYTYWDGTIPGPDGVTPQGPPRAIRLTITFQFTLGGKQISKQLQQVLAIPSAPGMYTVPMYEPPTDGGNGSVIATPAAGGAVTVTVGGAGAAKGGATGAAGGKAGGTTGGGGGGTGGKGGGTSSGTGGKGGGGGGGTGGGGNGGGGNGGGGNGGGGNGGGGRGGGGGK
jgi:prepilin-type N-terminal cleavage/methylation domain-containing protein